LKSIFRIRSGGFGVEPYWGALLMVLLVVVVVWLVERHLSVSALIDSQYAPDAQRLQMQDGPTHPRSGVTR
jgi:prolipoprotein diacylglyceryltransferase